jgi:predicted metal-dependent hydrolase
MSKTDQIYKLEDIEFRIVYSRRRTLGISVLPDSSVIVRAPYRASLKTITGIVHQKAAWIIKHRDSYRNKEQRKLNGSMISGGTQLFRGKEYELQTIVSQKPSAHFLEDKIILSLPDTTDTLAIKKILNSIFKNEAARVFPEMVSNALRLYKDQKFAPTGLVIRSMKSRWGSCSRHGIITLSTELIKLPDIYIEYVIVHELCHLKHHNHGKEYYMLLSELFPDWKKIRKDLRQYVH